MDINLWKELSEVKAGILETACALKDDDLVDRLKAASRLLELSKRVHEMENVCLYQE